MVAGGYPNYSGGIIFPRFAATRAVKKKPTKPKPKPTKQRKRK